MKPVRDTILVFSRHPDLLDLRRWVLESRGYDVVAAGSLAQIDAVPGTRPVRVVLLCHTLSPGDRAAATALAARWSGAIVHTLAHTSRTPTGILGSLMHTCEGATDLVALVRTLLREGPSTLPKPSRRGKAAAA